MSDNVGAIDSVYDRAALLENFEGMEEVVVDIIQSYEENVPGLKERITNAIEASDASALQLAAHTLKGVLSNFYAERARSLAYKLEDMGKVGDLTHALTSWHSLCTELTLLNLALQKLASELRPI